MRASAIKAAVVCAVAAASGCLEAGDEASPPDEVEWRGQIFDRVDQVVDGVAHLPSAMAADPADALRMTILYPNGGAYTARLPNVEAALAAARSAGPIDRIARAYLDRPGAAARLAQAEQAAAGGGGVAERVIGSDGRTLSPTGTAPFNAITRVDVFDSPTGGGFRMSCTGAYIGPWTFVLAGHCLRYTDGAFARRIVFEPARAGGSLPFGRFDCRNGDASSSNDFLAAVPSGYTGTLDNSLDFAVIDTFPCHHAPTWFSGYVVDSGTATYAVHGYPIGLCPGASAEGTFMCGNSGQGYINEWRLESELVDTTDGEDGAPWWTINPTRVAGVNIGYREYFDLGRCGFSNCQRNYARRIDGAMDTFIRAIAFDF